MESIEGLAVRSRLPLRYRVYSPVVRLLSLLGRINVLGRHPFMVLRTVLNRVMYRIFLTKRALFSVETKLGFKVVVPLNDQGAASLVFLGEYSPDEAEVLRRLLPHSSSFTDVGCNLGYFTLYAKWLGGEGYPVVSADPNKFLCHLVENSMQLNQLRGAKVWNVAVGAVTGTASFLVDERLSTSGQIAVSDLWASGVGDEEVDVVTLSELVPLDDAVAGFPLIKVDVEGHEVEVLRGGSAELGKGAVVLCEVWCDTAAAIAAFVAALDYQILDYQGRRFDADSLVSRRRQDVVLVPTALVEMVQSVLSQ